MGVENFVLDVIGESSCIGVEIDDDVGDDTLETAAGEGNVFCEKFPIPATGERDTDCNVRSILPATEATQGREAD